MCRPPIQTLILPMQFCDRKAQNLKNANIDRYECLYGKYKGARTQLSVSLSPYKMSHGDQLYWYALASFTNVYVLHISKHGFL